MAAGCDWPTFMAAYAAGRWDPHKTPNPPVSSADFTGRRPDAETGTQRNPSSHFDSQCGSWTENSSSSTKQQRSPPIPVPTLGVARNSTGSIKSRTAMSLHLPIPNHRPRNLLSTSLPNHPVADQVPPSSSVPHTNVQTTVATMRWAAARVDISPLALPSPEHELTDPMRGVTATIPGSHSRDSSLGSDYLITPGGTRRLRLPSFWRGTTDIENAKLLTIEGSPPEPTLQLVKMDESPKIKESSAVFDDVDTSPRPISSSKLPSPPSPTIRALAPSPISEVHPHADSSAPPIDYFGDARPPLPDFLNVGSQLSRNDKPREATSAPATSAVIQIVLPPHSDDESTVTVTKRISLTRQASSPLPVGTLPDANTAACSRLTGARAVGISNDKNGSKPSCARFEQHYSNMGYLSPPSPPDELERRRALYKYARVIDELRC